ncbi:MAG: flagellar motor switch protein FliN [Oscillospiraceae bacterium]|jgi:flagellar motor switch protein FliN/FliY|nr:flagellar motor switch protein FliN [Oscillospiraceae bacterium]
MDLQVTETKSLMESSLTKIFGAVRACFSNVLSLDLDLSIREIVFEDFSEFRVGPGDELIGTDFFINNGKMEKFGLLFSKKEDVRVLFSSVIGMQIAQDSFEFDVVARETIFELLSKVFLEIKESALRGGETKPLELRAEDIFLVGDLRKYVRRFRREKLARVTLNFSVTTLINSELCLFLPCALFPQSKAQKNLVTDEASGAGFEKVETSPDLDKARGSTVQEFKAPRVADVKKVEAAGEKRDAVSGPNKIIYERSERKSKMQETSENAENVEAKVSEHDLSDTTKEERSDTVAPSKGSGIKLAEFESFEEEDSAKINNLSNLKLVMSIPVDVRVELGRTQKKIKEVLEYGKGTVIQLDKHAGSQVDIIINGQKIAKGDVVVVEENFGVRITEIAKPKDLLDIL